MSYLKHLKSTKMSDDNRWICKFNNETGRISEIKLIFDPDSYKEYKNAKKLLKKDELIKLLENEKK